MTEAFYEHLAKIRHQIHQHPEVSEEEHETTVFLKGYLKNLGIEPLNYPLKTGLIAEIGSGHPIIALRADIDALPIKEKTGLPYASDNGAMHACGHDFHQTSLLGAAQLLKEREAGLKGTVRLIFQPAEENFQGAYQVIEAGGLDGVSAIIGYHNNPHLKPGQIGLRSGAIMAGASIGGSLGSSIGGLIGDNNHGWRGGYRGSAIGNIVGTIAGAAIGNALTAPRQEQIEEDAYIPEVREVRVQKYKKQPVQQPISQLKLRKIRFIDDNRSHVIDAGENSKIIFEIMNEGRNPVYNVVPVVETVGKVKHLGISPSVMVEEILPGEGIRYTASIHAGEKLKDGEVTFRVAVADENGVICDSQEFTLPTQRGN